MDLKDIKQIIKVLEGTDITEIELEQEGVKVRVKRGRGNTEYVHTSSPVVHRVAELTDATPTSFIERHLEVEQGKLKTISSPMVGIYYNAPAPDAPRYVEVGSVVTKGQTLCIIEAMKLMNEIEADCSGRIASILVENAQAVEYGEPLFMIEPS